MVTWSTQHALDHGHNARAVEKLLLLCIFLKYACKRKSLYRSFAVVICRGLNGDVCRVVSFAIFDREEARIGGM
jgi:hypothetical protein